MALVLVAAAACGESSSGGDVTNAGTSVVSVSGGAVAPQSVSIAQGSANEVASGSCAPGQCKWVNISTSGWAAGESLTITCIASLGEVGPYTKSANGSGAYSTSGLCMYAPGASNVHVIINGVSSNTISPWP